MTVGEKFIAELARRGQLGQFFDFQGYRSLRRVDSVESLEEFLGLHGFSHVAVTADIAATVDDFFAKGAAQACHTTQRLGAKRIAIGLALAAVGFWWPFSYSNLGLCIGVLFMLDGAFWLLFAKYWQHKLKLEFSDLL